MKAPSWIVHCVVGCIIGLIASLPVISFMRYARSLNERVERLEKDRRLAPAELNQKE